MVGFNLGAMNKFARVAFQIDFEEKDLFEREWLSVYSDLTGLLGELEIKRRTVIEIRYGLLKNDERLKNYEPMKNCLYSSRVVSEVLAKTMGKERYSRNRASQLEKDGMRRIRSAAVRSGSLWGLSFGKKPISFREFSDACSGVFLFDKGEYSTFTGSENRSLIFDLPISVLNLSIRAANTLDLAKVETIGMLARMTEQALMKYRNFGRRSLNEVKDKLGELGLSLGMNID